MVLISAFGITLNAGVFRCHDAEMSTSLSGAVSCNLVTRGWRCITETLFIAAVLLLIEGPGHGLER